MNDDELSLESEEYIRRLAREVRKSIQTSGVYFGQNRIINVRVERYNPVQDAWRRHPGTFLVVTTAIKQRFAIGVPYPLFDGFGNKIVASREIKKK